MEYTVNERLNVDGPGLFLDINFNVSVFIT